MAKRRPDRYYEDKFDALHDEGLLRRPMIMPEERQFNDITKVCKDCRAEFTIEAGELKWLYDKFGDSFNEPVRCKPCRQAKKARNEGR
jgi:hypothetical protein